MPNTPTDVVDNWSMADIVKDAIANIEDLVRSEIRLAKLEIREEARKAAWAAGLLTAGGVMVLYGIGFLLVAVYLVISYEIWPWLSCCVVGGFLTLFGGAVAGSGFRKLRRVELRPERTLETLGGRLPDV